MRGRLTPAFACFVPVMTSIGGGVRVHAPADVARMHELDRLTTSADLIGTFIEHLAARGELVTADRLSAFVPAETELTVTREGSATVTATGTGFDAADADRPTRVEETAGDTTVTLVRDASVVADATREQQLPLFFLLAALVLFAGPGRLCRGVGAGAALQPACGVGRLFGTRSLRLRATAVEDPRGQVDRDVDGDQRPTARGEPATRSRVLPPRIARAPHAADRPASRARGAVRAPRPQ
ncbi:hypothetical protein [Nocardioides sp. B-3]|uniref:hypothetical protein n=1 Tax=Nocardioides sp. B-3 TaxID=2895565 RepID=UPI002152FFBD|nr:hypothetical protein [Nocardioides sp. B-3]UUZ60142.1 hypothetical protein LP418_04045 [Nocardioides sp. B-3]